MPTFGEARITPSDWVKYIRARSRGAFVSLSDIARWRRTQKLETERLVRVQADGEVLLLWPHADFRDQPMMRAIEKTFMQFGFALHRHGPRPLSETEFGRLRKSYSERFLAQALPNGTTWLEAPLKVRFGSDEEVNRDLLVSFGTGSEWKSLKEIRDIAAGVRMRHLPPGSSGYEFYM